MAEADIAELGRWKRLPDGKPFTLNDGHASQTRTCGEWVKARGRGLLGSANY